MNNIVEKLLYDGYSVSLKDGFYNIDGVQFKELLNGELIVENAIIPCKKVDDVKVVISMNNDGSW